MAIKMMELAAKGASAYSWFVYGGKTMDFDTRFGELRLQKGTKYGVRKSADGKQLRLVIDAWGTGKVLTLSEKTAGILAKNSKPAGGTQPTGESGDPLVFMKAAGYKLLGEGGEGTVWEKAGKAVKVIKAAEAKTWRKFVAFCRAHPNQHYPKFGDEYTEDHGGVSFVFIPVEKLKRASNKDLLLVKYICDKIRGRRLFDPKDPDDVADARSTIGKAFTDYLLTDSTFEQAVRAVVKAKAGSLEEIDTDNVMKRGDTLVIIDA